MFVLNWDGKPVTTVCACESSAGTKHLMKQFKERTKDLFWLTVLGVTCRHNRESTAEEQEAGWSHCSCGQGTEMMNACVQIFPRYFSLEPLLMGWYHLQIRWLFLPHLIPHRQVLINMLKACFQGGFRVPRLSLGYHTSQWDKRIESEASLGNTRSFRSAWAT